MPEKNQDDKIEHLWVVAWIMRETSESGVSAVFRNLDDAKELCDAYNANSLYCNYQLFFIIII